MSRIDEEKNAPGQPDGSTTGGVRPASVLVVDDVPDNRDLLSRRVGNMGHSIAQAQDGRQAMQSLREKPFDLVLLDIMMPVMTGYEVLEQMKADPELRHIPVIVISANDQFDSVIRCIGLGAEDYLVKPFDKTLLKARIDASLERKQLRDRERETLACLAREQVRSQRLLLSIFPAAVADRLKADPGSCGSPRKTIADSYPDATVLFASLCNFTQLSSRHPAAEVVARLDRVFSGFDHLAERLGVERVKTIGDTWMGIGGVPVPRPDHAQAVADLALAMQEEVVKENAGLPEPLTLRVGIDTGPVIAGVIGAKKFAYDVWGRVVDAADQMESFGLDGHIQVTAAARDRLAEKYVLDERGAFYIDGVGEVETYLLAGRK